MAWNPSPMVAIARDAAKKLNADRVVVLYTNEKGQAGYVSYGKDQQHCALAKAWGDKMFSATMEYFEDYQG